MGGLSDCLESAYAVQKLIRQIAAFAVSVLRSLARLYVPLMDMFIKLFQTVNVIYIVLALIDKVRHGTDFRDSWNRFPSTKTEILLVQRSSR